jgi:phosphoglycolate phosphatase
VRFRPSAVIFDFDGTLVDSAQIKRDAFFEVLPNLPLAKGCLETLLLTKPPLDRYSIADRLAHALADGPVARNMAREIAQDYSIVCRKKVGDAPEIAGASEIICGLKERGIPLFISSATPQNELLQVVDGRPWSGAFQGIYGSPDTKLQHLDRIRCDVRGNPPSMLLIGDSEHDADTAQAFGCIFGAVGPSCGTLPGATFRGFSLLELHSALGIP